MLVWLSEPEVAVTVTTYEPAGVPVAGGGGGGALPPPPPQPMICSATRSANPAMGNDKANRRLLVRANPHNKASMMDMTAGTRYGRG